MIPSALLDRLELPFLVGLQDQKSLLARVRRQTEQGVQALMPGQNGTVPVSTATTPTTAANTSTALEDDNGIVNRSPTINYYLGQEVAGPQLQPAQQRSNPSAWIPVLLIAGVVGAAVLWWLYTHPVQSAPLPVTSSPATGHPGYHTELEIR